MMKTPIRQFLESNTFLLSLVGLLFLWSLLQVAFHGKWLEHLSGAAYRAPTWEARAVYASQALLYTALTVHLLLRHARRTAWLCAAMAFSMALAAMPFEVQLLVVPVAAIALVIAWALHITSSRI